MLMLRVTISLHTYNHFQLSKRAVVHVKHDCFHYLYTTMYVYTSQWIMVAVHVKQICNYIHTTKTADPPNLIYYY